MTNKKLISTSLALVMMASVSSASAAEMQTEPVTMAVAETEMQTEIQTETPETVMTEALTEHKEEQTEASTVQETTGQTETTQNTEAKPYTVHTETTEAIAGQTETDLPQEDFISASVSILDPDTEKEVIMLEGLTAGDEVALSISLQNDSSEDSVFTLHFRDVEDTLPEEKEEWLTFGTSCEEIGIPDAKEEDGKVTFKAKDTFGNTFERDGWFLEERNKKEEITDRYFQTEVKAGENISFKLKVTSDELDIIALIPEIDSELQDAAYLIWEYEAPETEVETETELSTEETTEEATEEATEETTDATTDTTEETEEEFFFEETDVSDLNKEYFSEGSVILKVKEKDILDPENVIGEYNGLYLMQYPSVEQAMYAYQYYKANAKTVEPGETMETA